MGTNYYLQHRVNDDGRVADMHIGKTSAGWKPSLVGYEASVQSHGFNIKSWFEWKMFLAGRIKEFDGRIFNEYNEYISLNDFINLMETHGVGGKIHAQEALDGEFGKMFHSDEDLEISERQKRYWVDAEGYSFYDGVFG